MLEVTPYDLPPFEVAPPRVVPDVKPTPHDSRTTFVIFSGLHSDRHLIATFVGNRLAANQFCAEWDRYAPEDDESDFHQHLDYSAPHSPFVPREYPDFYTEVAYTSLVIVCYHRTGEPRLYHRTQTEVKPTGSTVGDDWGRAVSKITPAGNDRFEVVTRAPDHLNEDARRLHVATINDLLKSEANQ